GLVARICAPGSGEREARPNEETGGDIEREARGADRAAREWGARIAEEEDRQRRPAALLERDVLNGRREPVRGDLDMMFSRAEAPLPYAPADEDRVDRDARVRGRGAKAELGRELLGEEREGDGAVLLDRNG